MYLSFIYLRGLSFFTDRGGEEKRREEGNARTLPSHNVERKKGMRGEEETACVRVPLPFLCRDPSK